MKLCSLALDVAPLTVKITKNRLNVFERGENLLQNVLHFVFWISQLSEIELQRKRKTDFSERAPQFKGYYL